MRKMSMSIKYDPKFRKLINRYMFEYKRMVIEKDHLEQKKKHNMLMPGEDFILGQQISEMQDKAETTLNHIFKYIDRYLVSSLLDDNTN